MVQLGTKEWWANVAALYLIFFLVWVPGFDRFYRGQVGWGIVKFLTLGGLFIWHFIDLGRYFYRLGLTGQWVRSPLEVGA